MPLLRMAVAAVIAFGLDRLMAWNTGVNFGLLDGYSNRWALVALAVVFSVGLTIWARNKRGWILPLAIGVAVGGALGNACDRVIYGAVADYLNMSCCGIHNPYSFNVADIFVICGMVLIAINIESKHQVDKA